MVRMAHLGIGLTLGVALVAFGGCGTSEAPDSGATSGAIGLVDAKTASGVYEVSGVTVQAAHGGLRKIAGTLRLRVEGDLYSVDFELDTTAPGTGASLPVQVAGAGSGVIVDGVFTGTTEERIRAADPQAATAPSAVDLQVVSTSQAHFDELGHFKIQLQNYPAEDEEYSPSVTVLSGQRIEALPARVLAER